MGYINNEPMPTMAATKIASHDDMKWTIYLAIMCLLFSVRWPPKQMRRLCTITYNTTHRDKYINNF